MVLSEFMQAISENILLDIIIILEIVIIVLLSVLLASKKKENQKNSNVAKVEAPAEEPKAEEEAPAEEVVAEEEAPAEEPVAEEEAPAEEPVAEEEAPAEEPVAEEEVPAEEVVAEEEAPAEEPVAEEELAMIVNEVAEEAQEEKTRKVVGKFEVYQVGDIFRYNLKASNGEILVESELYSSKDGALSAIETLQNSLESCEFKVSKDKKGLYQFKVLAGNHRILVTSANYTSESNANKAIESFKRFVVDANIVELEEEYNNFQECELDEKDPKQGGKIQLFFEEESDYFFKVIANNGSVLCTSEDYTTKQGALNGIETLKSAINEGKFYISRDKNDNYQFRLYSAANRLIAVGETYGSKQQAKSSANSLVNFIEEAELITDIEK